MAIRLNDSAATMTLSFITHLPRTASLLPLTTGVQCIVLDLFIQLGQESMLARFFQSGAGAELIVGRSGRTEFVFPPRDNQSVQTPAAYLEGLNPEQRRAVEHGAAGPGPFAPLLVIAGAGSGKTNTLAHRVAHLIVNGADPRRILLMTFSRRAASEMTKRVERIARKVMGDRADVMTDALTWAGT